MEAHDTTTTTDTSPKAGALARLGAVVLALVLAFVAAVAFVVVLDIGDTATCADVLAGEAEFNSDNECYAGSDTEKTIALVLGWPGAFVAAIAALLALAFAVRGRGGRPLLIAIAVGAVLLGLSLAIG